jgi:hypothetical protein
MRTPRNNDPAVIRALIERLRTSSNGDERLMGDALHFYANGCHDEALVGVLDSTTDSFIEILMSVREQLYVNRDVSELTAVVEAIKQNPPKPYKPGDNFEGPLKPGN